MRFILRVLAAVLGLFVAIAAGLWMFGPREPVVLSADFDPRRFGEGVQVYFESVEAAHDDLTPGTEKRVIWQDGFKEQRTPVSLLYIHGFSASAEELRPVPDLLAARLGANLVYTRLTGHGRDGAALAEAQVQDWMQDVAEGVAAARAVGDKVVVLATSTGGPLTVAALFDARMAQDVAGVIFVSPNFAINDPAAGLLTLPGAEWWLPVLAGSTRQFTPANAQQATYWTTEYPVQALLQMAALVRAVRGMDVTGLDVPALFWFAQEDQVVRADITRDVAARWGGPAEVHMVQMGPGIDPFGHVLAGDILSPAGTGPAVQGMLDWIRAQGIGGM